MAPGQLQGGSSGGDGYSQKFSMALFLSLSFWIFVSIAGLEVWVFFVGFAGAFVVWVC